MHRLHHYTHHKERNATISSTIFFIIAHQVFMIYVHQESSHHIRIIQSQMILESFSLSNNLFHLSKRQIQCYCGSTRHWWHRGQLKMLVGGSTIVDYTKYIYNFIPLHITVFIFIIPKLCVFDRSQVHEFIGSSIKEVESHVDQLTSRVIYY